MKTKFIYHVSLVLEGGRSSMDYYCTSLRGCRTLLRNLRSYVSKFIINGDLKKGDEYEFFIDRGFYVGDLDIVYCDYPDNIYYLRKVVK